MAAIAKKILITTERHEVFVIRQNGREIIRGFCLECADEVEMMNFDSAISFSNISGRAPIKGLESGVIHSVETTTGHLLVCRNSLTH